MSESKPSAPRREPRAVGRYVLYDEIAAGGMATVHIGRLVGPAGFSRTVAIKRLHPQFAKDPEFASMFLDEARLAARIRHPHVVSTLDVVALEGELFLVMDYVQGESLARLLRACQRAGRRIPPRIAVSISMGTLLGLHAAHEATSERGEPLCIVHRDVSPQNVLVGVDGVARVVDFGVAKAASRLHTTEDGKIKGKLAYMAPEQLRHEKVDRRTDVFAASIVLWETLTGERLHHAEDAAAVVTKVLGAEPPRPSSRAPDVPPAIDAIVMRGLAKNPAARFATAREMAQALETALAPAGSLEVGAFVDSVAGEVLKERSEVVAEVESISTVDPMLGDVVAAVAVASAASGQISTRAAPRGATPATGTDLSLTHAESLAPGAGSAPKRRSGLLVAIGVVLVLGIGGLVAWRRQAAPSEPPAPAAALPSNAASPPAEAKLEPAKVQSPVPEPSAAGSVALPEPSASSPAPSASAPAAKPGTVTRSTSAAGPKSGKPGKPSCDPPFVLNPDGSKRFKPECF